MVGYGSAFSAELRASPTTPITVYTLPEPTIRIARPNGSSLPQTRSARPWLTIITFGPVAVSPSVNCRPRRSGISIVRKYPGLTLRQSIGIDWLGSSRERPTGVAGVLDCRPLPNGTQVVIAAPLTPGSDSRRSTKSRYSAVRFATVSYLAGCGVISNVSNPS